jgi:hypothetical protein
MKHLTSIVVAALGALLRRCVRDLIATAGYGATARAAALASACAEATADQATTQGRRRSRRCIRH